MFFMFQVYPQLFTIYKQDMFKKRNQTCDEIERKRSCRNLIYTNLSHTHTHTYTQIHTTQPVPNHTSSDPGLRSFQTVHICSTVILHTVCVTVCVCACYPVVFLCKSHVSTGPQTPFWSH